MEYSGQLLGIAPIGTLMRQYGLPCVISLLVGALYNIVDQIFIANASYLGSYGNAANTTVFPLTVVALALAVMVGDGCCAFVSISLGKRDTDSARRSVGNSIVMSIFSSLLLTALYLLFQAQLISMFGGTVNEETFHYCQEYFFFISMGIPFYMFGQAMNPIIRADGNPNFAMASTLAGAAVGTAGFLLAECFPHQLISIFGAANESVYYTDFAITAFRVYLCLIILACVNKACFIFLQAMGKAVASTVLSLIREVVFGVGFALLLPLFFGLDGVLLSMPVSDLLTFLAAVVLILRTYAQLSGREDET